MRIAFVGKGGSGKTTLAALFARWLGEQGAPVIAIDADINQHLGTALGLLEDEAAALPPMGNRLAEIKDYLRGSNPLIRSAAVMTKTTPPGRGSRLLGVRESNPLYEELSRHVAGVRLMATGPFTEDDMGVACYHSKVGAAELVLNHLIDLDGEYVVVDMTAGADAFASGMFTRFDLTLVVVEPTLRSVAVLRQYAGYAREFDVAIAVVGNKVRDPGDLEFLREHAGAERLVGWFDQSDFVRDLEKGRFPPLEELRAREPENLATIEAIRDTLDARPKDWARSHRQAIEFHVRNARAWANAAVGEDVTGQVDRGFVLDPSLVARA
jgi:CO dehydrogenase maturation factor